MADLARFYQAGYLDPATGEWVVGTTEEDAEVGYYDIELEVWAIGVPDILSGEWMPPDAILTTADAYDCPEGNPIKGNLPSRIYHLPDQVTYARTIPEICFASEAAAIAAGFRAARVSHRPAEGG